MKRLLRAIAALPLHKRIAVVALLLLIVVTWTAACAVILSH